MHHVQLTAYLAHVRFTLLNLLFSLKWLCYKCPKGTSIAAIQQNKQLHIGMFLYRHYTVHEVNFIAYQLSKNQTCHQPLEVYPLHHDILNLIRYSHVVGSNLTQRFHSFCPALVAKKAHLWSPKNRNHLQLNSV